MQQFGGKDSKRHFTVVMGGKEHGLYVSSTPSSAARKAVTKLCAANKSKKVEFEIREITQGSKKKTYGPYLGHIEKLKEPIKLEGRIIKYKPVAKIAGKRSEMKGGVSEFNTTIDGLSTTEAIEKMIENFKVENQQYPDPFHYKKRLFGHDTIYFGIEHLLEIDGQKYYPFSIHFIKNIVYIRFLINTEDNNIQRTLNMFDKFIRWFTIKNHRIIEFKVNILVGIIKDYTSAFDGLSNYSIGQGTIVPNNWYMINFKEFVEKILPSLISIIDLIDQSDKIKDVDKESIKESIKSIKINLEKEIEDFNKISKVKINKHKKIMQNIQNKKNKENLLKRSRYEFPNKIKEFISRPDTNNDTKKFLQEIIDLITVTNENRKKVDKPGEYFNSYSWRWKKHNEAYEFLKDKYIERKKYHPEEDSIDIIKELLKENYDIIKNKKNMNTKRSELPKNESYFRKIIDNNMRSMLSVQHT
jgi:hypothetical protein